MFFDLLEGIDLNIFVKYTVWKTKSLSLDLTGASLQYLFNIRDCSI